MCLAEYYSVVNDPRNEYNRALTVEMLGNVEEGRPVRCRHWLPSFLLLLVGGASAASSTLLAVSFADI